MELRDGDLESVWKLFVQETQCEVPRFSDRKQPLILGGLSGATHPLAKTRENLTRHVLHFEQRAATLGSSERESTVSSWKLDAFFYWLRLLQTFRGCTDMPVHDPRCKCAECPMSRWPTISPRDGSSSSLVRRETK